VPSAAELLLNCQPQPKPICAQVQAVLDDNFDPDGMTQECVPVDSAELWWAGKKMTRDKLLCDFVGRNDKTKVRAVLLGSDGVAAAISAILMPLTHRLWPSCKSLAPARPRASPSSMKRPRRSHLLCDIFCFLVF
jgi:hypothetical protein